MGKFDNIRSKLNTQNGGGVNLSTHSVVPASEIPQTVIPRPVRPTQMLPELSYDITQSPLLEQIQANPAPHTPVQDVIAQGARSFANLPGVKQTLSGLGKAVEFVEGLPVINEIGGALANSYNQLAETPVGNPSSWIAQARKNLADLATSDSGNAPVLKGVQSIIEGARNPEEAKAREAELIAKQTQGMGPVSKFATSALVQTATDPLSLIPATAPLIPGVGRGISKLRELAARRSGQVEQVIQPTLSLPQGRGEARINAAMERSNLSPNQEPIVGTGNIRNPEPIGLPEPNIGAPTRARVTTRPNEYTQKLENLFNTANQMKFTPGRELEELESLWSQMAGPRDPNLNELIDLAYPKQTSKLSPESLSKARTLQQQREVAGAPLKAKSMSDRYQTYTGDAGLPRERVGFERTQVEITPPKRNFATSDQALNASPEPSGNVQQLRELAAQRTAPAKPRVEEPTIRQPEEPTTIDPIPTQEITELPVKGNWFTRLFGDQQGLGISPFGSSRSNRIVTTEQQIVNNPLKSTVKGFTENAKQAVRSTYQNTVDYLSPLKNISREAYDTAMDASRANNMANTIIRDKFVDLEGNVIGKSLNEVMANSRGLGKKVDDYLVLRHAVDRMRRGERVYDEGLAMTPEKAEQAIARLEQRFPQLKNLGQEWNKYNENLLSQGVKEGLITQEAMNAMRTSNPNYAAMKRQFTMSEKLSRPTGTGAGFSGQNAPIQKVSPTGSTRRIVSPLRSAVEQTYAWQNAMLRNRTMQEVVKTVQRDPEGMKGLVEIVKKPSTSYKSLDDALREGGSEEFLNQLDNDYKTLFTQHKPGDENIVRAMVNGKPVYVKVNDPEAVKALLGMGSDQSGLILHVMQTLSNATKRSATGLLAPMFSIKSLVGDTFQAAIQSENPLKHVGVDLPAAIFSSIGDVLKIPGMKNLAEDFRRSGGEYSALLRGDKAVNKSVRSLRKEAPFSPGGVVKGAEIAVKAPFKTLEKVANTSENLNRMAAFRRAMVGKERTPENVRKAINAARESTTNFSRKGAFSKQTEAFAPYSNAAVQSIYRLAKSGIKNPVKTLAGATTLILAPKLYEFAKFNDDPDYQNLPARERYRNIFYSKNADGTFNKAPMPMEYEALAGFVTDVLNDVLNKDPQAYKGTLDALANSLTPPLVSGALQGVTQGGGPKQSLTGLANASVAGPFAAVIGNKSFTGAPIVPQDVAKFSTPYQYNEKTSEPAKVIGQKIGMSPMMVDYLIRQYSGDFGRLVLPTTSDVGSGTKQATLFKNFVTDPVFTNTLTNDFYDASEKLKQAYQDNQGKEVPLPKWYDDELRKYVTSTAKGSISKQLSDLSSEKKEVSKDQSLSAEQRAQILREIQRKMNDIYIDTNMKLQKAGVPMQSR